MSGADGRIPAEPSLPSAREARHPPDAFEGLSPDEARALPHGTQYRIILRWFLQYHEPAQEPLKTWEELQFHEIGREYPPLDYLKGLYNKFVDAEVLLDIATHLTSISRYWRLNIPELLLPDERGVVQADPALIRGELLASLAELQSRISALEGRHGGMGHNHPPDESPLSPDDLAGATRDLQALRVEVASPSVDRAVVEASARRLRETGFKVAAWLAGKMDKMTDEAFKSLGKAIGVGLPTVVAGWLLDLNKHAVHVFELASAWLKALGH